MDDDDDVHGAGGNNADAEDSEDLTADLFSHADDGTAAADKANEDETDHHWRQDKIGRWYKYDNLGNCMYNKPLHGSLRPPSIPADEWRKLSKKSKKSVHDTWKRLEDEKNKAQAEMQKLRAQIATSSSPASSVAIPPGKGSKAGKAKPRASVSAAARRTDDNANVRSSTQHQLPLATLMLTTLCATLSSSADEQRLTQALQDWLAALHASPEAVGECDRGASGGLRPGGDTPSGNAAVPCTTTVAAATRGSRHKKTTPSSDDDSQSVRNSSTRAIPTTTSPSTPLHASLVQPRCRANTGTSNRRGGYTTHV